MGEWKYRSTILGLANRWRCVVSSTPRPLYPRVKSPLYPLDRRLGRPQSWSRRCGVEKNLLPLPGIEPPSPIPQPVAIPIKYGLMIGTYIEYSLIVGSCVGWIRYNSGSVATGYRLDCQGTEVRFQAEARDLYHLHSIQTAPSLLSIGYQGFFPGVNRKGPEADHSPTSSAKIKNGGAMSPLPYTSLLSGF
jgi:hypothetical protein